MKSFESASRRGRVYVCCSKRKVGWLVVIWRCGEEWIFDLGFDKDDLHLRLKSFCVWGPRDRLWVKRI